MKLHFEPNLDYQHAAIESVCDLFRGQETCRTEFTVTLDLGRQMALTGMESDLGIGNRLQLLDDEIVANLNDIQLRNGLAPSSTLASGDFTVEMETGTGKTYVYLRTVFELNKRYGFTKFVIVVPALLCHPRGQAPHGLSPGRGGCLRTETGQADRGGFAAGRRRAQQGVHQAAVHQ